MDSLYTVDKIITTLKQMATPQAKASREYFGITGVNSFGLTTPQIRSVAKKIGTNHDIALALWKTGNHEAKHIAAMIADVNMLDNRLMELWIKDFNSWDIVDGCCSSYFRKSKNAFEKAIEWTKRKKEFEKRAGFTMMAQLAVHEKKAYDTAFEKFLPVLFNESTDERNFVRKANNWALRQIGKRNVRLCKEAIKTAKDIYNKGDASSRWIATDAIRELEKYLKEGKIKNVGIK